MDGMERLNRGENLKIWDKMPVYVTREYGEDKIQSSYEASAGASLLIIILAWLNAIGWGIFGIVELVSKVL